MWVVGGCVGVCGCLGVCVCVCVCVCVSVQGHASPSPPPDTGALELERRGDQSECPLCRNSCSLQGNSLVKSKVGYVSRCGYTRV